MWFGTAASVRAKTQKTAKTAKDDESQRKTAKNGERRYRPIVVKNTAM